MKHYAVAIKLYNISYGIFSFGAKKRNEDVPNLLHGVITFLTF